MSAADPPHADAPTSPEELSHLAEAMDRAVAEIMSLDPPLRSKALALKAAIEAFHKGGLTTIVKRLKADPRGKELLFELVDEPHVHALFSMHGIVRADITTSVARVIEMVRPSMQSHGGDVTLVEVRDQKAFVQPVTQGAGWVAGPRVEEVTAERPVAFAAGEARVIVVRSKEGLRAFRNACGHVGLPLDRAACDLEAGTLTCPWHGFTFDTDTGGCFSSPGLPSGTVSPPRKRWTRLGTAAMNTRLESGAGQPATTADSLSAILATIACSSGRGRLANRLEPRPRR